MMETPRGPFTHPPSDPQPSVLSRGVDLAAADRPVRIQLFVALLLGLVLVATGLYLWRRPRATLEASDPADATTRAAPAEAPQAAVAPDAGAPSTGVVTTEPRILACQDRGPKKTPVEQCDHVTPIEQAFEHAVETSSACVPAAAGGGTISYLVDVSFLHKRIGLHLPKEGRSMKNAKAVSACGAAVKQALEGVQLDGLTHAHGRYKISITATYPGALK
jgi:hypothetical protein